MKRTIKVLLALLITSYAYAEEESNLRLELELPVRTLRLGHSTKLKLKIVGSGIYEIIKDTEGIKADNMKAGAFVYEFEFRPQRKGRFTFGPYTLSVNGRKLTSKQISINVLPQWDGTYGTFFRVDSNSILLGEDVELVMETWAKKYNRISIFLDRDDSFSYVSSGLSSYRRKSRKEGDVCCTTRTWFITPKKPGQFKISKEIFRDFPADIDPPEFIIKVEEPAQQPPECDK